MTPGAAAGDLIQEARRIALTPALAGRLIGLIDLTSLDSADTTESVRALCRRASTPAGPVAAVCIYPAFVTQSRRDLAGSAIRVATVIDFPGGDGAPDDVAREAELALRAGADEIDLVLPYRRFLGRSAPQAIDNVRTVRKVCGADITLKVILEVSAFPDAESLAAACQATILAGANFLKTSTGKTGSGATLEAAAIMLAQIAASRLPVGFKASGGVRTFADAAPYLALAESILGEGWVSPATFRIGASALLPDLLSRL